MFELFNPYLSSSSITTNCHWSLLGYESKDTWAWFFSEISDVFPLFDASVLLMDRDKGGEGAVRFGVRERERDAIITIVIHSVFIIEKDMKILTCMGVYITFLRMLKANLDNQLQRLLLQLQVPQMKMLSMSQLASFLSGFSLSLNYP